MPKQNAARPPDTACPLTTIGQELIEDQARPPMEPDALYAYTPTIQHLSRRVTHPSRLPIVKIGEYIHIGA